MTTKVYFTPATHDEALSSLESKIVKLFEVAELDTCISKQDLVAIKLHIGEKNNTTHISPSYVKPVVERIKQDGGKPFLTDTNTLYRGQRSNAVDHLHLAHEHGFTIDNVGAPMIISDGLLGTSEREVTINVGSNPTITLASEAVMANAFIVLTHPTGHPATGLGATLKNIGMGLSSRKGKLTQHSKMHPKIDEDKCVKCGTCVKWCPQNTIEMREKSAFIIEEGCIGCGECLAVCRFGAVMFDWGVSSEELQKRIAEHAYGAVKDKQGKVGYMSFLLAITKGCDCFGTDQKPIMPDIGIIAGKDPVALDQAALDLIQERTGKTLVQHVEFQGDLTVQLAYAEEIGLGKRAYELVKI